MATDIDDLTEVLEVASGDQFPLSSAAEGSPRKASLNTITTYILEQLEPLSGLERQTAAPITGATVTVAPSEDGVSVRLIVKPLATLAALTIALPNQDDAEDGQEVLITCTQIITALTVSAGTLSVAGAPTALTANQFFRMMYDAVDTTWYRVG